MHPWEKKLIELTFEAMEKQKKLYGRVNFDSAYDSIFPELGIPPDAKKTYKAAVKKAVQKMGLMEKGKNFPKRKQAPVLSPKKISSLAKQARGMIWQEKLP